MPAQMTASVCAMSGHLIKSHSKDSEIGFPDFRMRIPFSLKIVEIPNLLADKGNWNNATSAKNENNVETNSEIKIDVWPNPVQSILNAKIATDLDEEISLELFDGLGRNLVFQSGHLPFELIELDLTQNPPGTYLLKFSKKDGSLIKTLLITKQ